MCNTHNPDPEHVELYFEMDFIGDGAATHAGPTGADCRAIFIYPAGQAFPRLCLVDRDRTTHADLHARQCASYHVMAGFCHSINRGDFGFCPTGATRVCDTKPIVGSDGGQATLACEACFGAGTCMHTGTVPAVTHFGGTPFEADYEYRPGMNPGAIYGTGPGGSLEPSGRWAP
jgi:hypothetical protein